MADPDDPPLAGPADELRVRFGTPEHGWLPVSIGIGATAVELRASYIPDDSVGLLVERLPMVLERGGSCRVPFNTEPDLYVLELERAGKAVGILVTHHPDGTEAGPGAVVLEGSAAPETVLLAFWRGLRGLEASLGPDAYATHWGHDLPEERLRVLARLATKAERRGAR